MPVIPKFKVRTVLLVAVCAVALLVASDASAKRFKNAWIEFELPAGWQCKLEEREWVCQGTDARTKTHSILIMAAKLRGPDDTLEAYREHLRRARTYQAVNGRRITAKIVSSPRIQSINGRRWVDATHEDSEIPGFTTRYAATVTPRLGILLTYSVRTDQRSATEQELGRIVRSVRLPQ